VRCRCASNTKLFPRSPPAPQASIAETTAAGVVAEEEAAAAAASSASAMSA